MADTLFINDDGLKRALDIKTGAGGGSLGTGTLRLFTAPTSVSQPNVLGDFTEATFAGYSPPTLIGPTWAVATLTAHVASSTYGANVTFTRSTTGAPQSIFGWFLTDAAKTKLYACALFASGPFTVTNAGDSITVVPTLTEQSLN
jgi:hypothetical protein